MQTQPIQENNPRNNRRCKQELRLSTTLGKGLKTLEDVVLEEPSEPEHDSTNTKIFKWELKLKKHHHYSSS